jgi:ATP-dependent DNA helicase RecG
MSMFTGGTMTDEELVEIIDNLRLLGSDVSDVEAKRAEGKLPKSLRETVSAFSNTRGGVVVLGVDEAANFTVTGVADAAKMSADFSAQCSDEMEPPVRPLIGIHQVEGKSVVVAEIPEMSREQKPVFYKGAGINQGSYIRVGDGDRKLSSYEVQVMLSSRGQPRDDERLTSCTVDDLNQELVELLVLRLKRVRPRAFQSLDKMGVLRRAKVIAEDDDGSGRVTLAGLLALGDYPQGEYPQLMISFVHYPTISGVEDGSGTRFVDNLVVEGSIPVMVVDALSAIRRNMSRRAIVSGVGRQDVWEYPETALREAIVNALVHRDLSPAAIGTQVQIEMYPDRLVVRNPGGLFGPVTIEELGEEGVSSSRNATLLRLLEEVPIPGEDRTVCENRGSGIRAMIASLRAAGMSPPKFIDRISSFQVTFPNHALLSDETVDWLKHLGERGLSDSQCIGLAMLREGQILDNQSYRTATGLDSRIATQELGDLVGRELVVQTGSRRWARYALNPRVQSTQSRHADRRLPPADRRDEILRALGEQVLSRAELASITGLSNQTVRRWLTILRREGLVEIAGGESPQSKNARYRRCRHAPPHGQQVSLDFELE